MLRNLSREQLIGGWIATLILLMAVSVLTGIEFTTSSVALWLIAGVVPAGVVFFLWHGAPTLSVKQLLRPSDDGSPSGRS